MTEQTPDAAAMLSEAFSSQPAETPAPVAEPTSTGHPAYQEILSQIPEALHQTVLPTLQKWDQGVNEKLASVQSQYDPIKAFKDYSPQDLQTGLDLVNFLNKNPEEFYKNMQQHYGFKDSGQGQSSNEFDLSEEEDDPRIAQLAQGQEQTLAQLKQMQEAQAAKEAEEWLNNKQAAITESFKTKEIEPDWDYIINRAQAEANKTGNFEKAMDNAAAAYEGLVSKFRGPVAANTPSAPPPPVLAPNAATPAAQQFDPNKLSDVERRKYVTQLLSSALKDS